MRRTLACFLYKGAHRPRGFLQFVNENILGHLKTRALTPTVPLLWNSTCRSYQLPFLSTLLLRYLSVNSMQLLCIRPWLLAPCSWQLVSPSVLLLRPLAKKKHLWNPSINLSTCIKTWTIRKTHLRHGPAVRQISHHVGHRHQKDPKSGYDQGWAAVAAQTDAMQSNSDWGSSQLFPTQCFMESWTQPTIEQRNSEWASRASVFKSITCAGPKVCKLSSTRKMTRNHFMNSMC